MGLKHHDKFDPVAFAVIKARIDGIVQEMVETVLLTSRNPILYGAKDFSCSILTHDSKILTMANSIPIHLITLDSPLRAGVECFGEDIHPGDCFVNNDPYHGNAHVGDFTMFAPVFYEGELACWAATKCHLIDAGAHLPTDVDPLAKNVYEEAIHFPPLRIVKDYKEIPEIIRFIKANFRYPDQWHGDFLAQVGSLWRGEQGIVKLCKKYGINVFKQFQDEFLDYGDFRMTQEVKKLPNGEWSIEALSEKVEPVVPEGVLLKMKMRIDPDQAVITFDLTEMPDQLPWGNNLSEACSRGACIQGVLPSLDPTLPRNDGVFRHFNFILREGAVVGIPKWPVGTSCATINICDEVTNMVLLLWERVQPGRGHAGNGEYSACQAYSAGTDFRHDNASYGHAWFVIASGGGASKGCDGWPTLFDNAVMGNCYLESIELTELKVPAIIWEVGIATDSGGAGEWRGASGLYQRIQPRHHTLTTVPWGTGHTSAALGNAGGKAGFVADHWLEKHATREKVRQLKSTGPFQIKEDEDWVVFCCGGGGYGDPLERDPEAVRDDARNYIISIKAAREEYGVVLNTTPELYEVDYDASEKLRTQLKEERGMK
jgi:N-methylhydantoinase B